MFWVCSPLLFIIAFAYRAYINRGQVAATPDEKLYSIYASTWRPGKAYGEAVDAFLKDSQLTIPPTRYGFFAVCSLLNRGRQSWTQCFKPVTWIATTAGALAAPIAFQITHDLPSALLVASSPLSLLLSRKALQDTFTAVALLLCLWAIQAQNAWLLMVATAMALASREAFLFFLPALLIAWVLRTSHWLGGALALVAGATLSVTLYYLVGGRKLLAVFRKLKQPTDYVRRFQSGPIHRLLIDLILISPVVALIVLTNVRMPIWLLGFAGVGFATHSFITPKNIRFLLIIDLCLRMSIASLPGHWPWVVLFVGSLADLWIYSVYGKIEDPVTANLIVRGRMYLEK